MKNTLSSKTFLSILFTGALLCSHFLAGCGRSATPLPEIQTITSETAPAETTETEVSEITTKSTEEASYASSESVAPEPAPAEPTQLTLLMVGDILLHTPVEESALQADGSYNFDAIFAHTADTIQGADLALVNQEVIIGGEELGISGYPAFNAPYAIGDALVDAGFDVVCHATNHALDKGKRGIVNCSAYWREEHPEITVLGIHDTDPAAEITSDDSASASESSVYFYTKDDITVAILNYTYGTNGIPLPADMPYAVDLLEEARVTADIQYAEEHADFTIVCPHWGTEYRLRADSMQAKWTKLFLENGVDLVLGTHPHVIEPIEWVEDEATGHRMLVYYSLGNFVNWTSGTGAGVSNRMVGGMAEVTLTRIEDAASATGTSDSTSVNDQETADIYDKVVISDYSVEAVVCHVQKGTDGVTVYPLADYPSDLSAENAILSQAPDFSRAYCVELCDTIWGDQWH